MEEPAARVHALLPAGPVDSPALPLGSPSPEQLVRHFCSSFTIHSAAPRLSALTSAYSYPAPKHITILPCVAIPLRRRKGWVWEWGGFGGGWVLLPLLVINLFERKNKPTGR